MSPVIVTRLLCTELLISLLEAWYDGLSCWSEVYNTCYIYIGTVHFGSREHAIGVGVFGPCKTHGAIYK